MNQKTIFLLPLDLKGRKQTRITPKFIREVFTSEKKEPLPEHVQKKKNNIFTVELNRLIGKISEKKKEVKEESTIPQIVEINESNQNVTVSEPVTSTTTQTLEVPDYYEILNKIYSNHQPDENAYWYLKNRFEAELGITCFCFFFYETHTLTYYPAIHQGLSEKTQKNFHFQSNDKFLQNRSGGYTQLFFQPVLVNDIFFKKKLSSEEFAKYESITVKFFDEQKLKGILAIFNESEPNLTSEMIDKSMKKIDEIVEPLTPFLNSFFSEKVNSKIDSYDFMRKIVYSIRIQLKSLNYMGYITKVKIINFLEIEDSVTKFKRILQLIKNHLLKEEGIIEINYNEILLLTKENDTDKLIKYISDSTLTEFQFEYNSLKYPDHGKNPYLYF